MKSVWRQPLFVIGFAIMAFFLLGSFAFEWIFGNEPRQTFFIEENGRAVEGPPISPSLIHLLGTDQFGYEMVDKLMIGAKYTILSAMAVAAVRMMIAIPFGFMLATYFRKSRPFINSLIDPLHYIPMTIFAVYLLRPILWEPIEGFSTPLFVRIAVEVLIIAFLSLPIVAMLIGKEASLLYQQEYILASKTLGAGNNRIIMRHLVPLMREKLFVLYGQQVVETLVLFAHLGLFQLFLGGTDVSNDPMFGDPPKSISFEWAGLYGDTFRWLQGAPWLPLSPVFCFAIVIMAISAMIEGYTNALNGHAEIPKKRKKFTSVSDEVIEWNREQLREKMVMMKETK